MRPLFVILVMVLSQGLLGAGSAIRVVSDLAYLPDASQKHRLDLYLPTGREGEPLVVFVHGGAFMYGDRQDYGDVGKALASQGLATAVVSYRLFPETNADGSTQDVAAATAWAIAHASQYGFDRRNVFLAGHSAGAQIVALIGTHAGYLRRSGLPLSSLRGVFAVAGAYDVRDLSGEPDSWQKVDGHIYGETPEARAHLSPRVAIDPAAPPTIASCGSRDDSGSCDRALYFVRALEAAGCSASVIVENGADHMGMLRALVDPKDPLNVRFLEFIEQQSIRTP